MLKRVITILMLATTLGVLAQQQEQYSMYMMNNFLVNPAEGGTEKFSQINMGYRTQWVGVDNNSLTGNRGGAPKSIFLSGHTPLGKKQGQFEDVMPLAHHGVGGVVSKDVAGLWNVINIKGSYSYHLPVTRDLTVSFGAFAGVKQYTYGGNDGEYAPAITGETDPVFGGAQSQLLPDMSLGIWGYSSKYYFGVSSFQLFGNQINLNTGGVGPNGNEGSLSRHYWVTGGYKIDLSQDYFLVPSFVVKYASPAAPQMDLNAKLKYKDLVWTGVSYRNLDAVVGLVGVTIKKQFDIAYAYDFGISSLRVGHKGSHEILVGLRLPQKAIEPPTAQFW